MICKIKNIIPKPQLVFILFFLIGFGCSDQVKETEQAKTIRLLSDNSQKPWSVDKKFHDDIEQVLSICDSSYILTLKADFTWNETNLQLACYYTTDGIWSLNEENNVISISYIGQSSGIKTEKTFEIEELSEKYFAYQYVENNELQKVRLKAK